MSKFFGDDENNTTKYIPPDYTDASETIGPSDDDDDDDDDEDLDFDDEEDEEDEGKIETILDEQNKKQEEVMQSTPFGNPNPSPTPTWGGQGSSSPIWGNNNPVGNNGFGWGNNNGGSIWGNQRTTNPWNTNNNINNNNGEKKELDRTKKVIFIDFLDAVVETYQSNGIPGLIPRDIYDIKPRFDVWQKLAAFNPERLYALAPRNLLANSTELQEGLNIALSYYCCSLAAFLRIPYRCCQVLVQGMVGQTKEDIINSILKGSKEKIPESDAVLIGINSGLYGQNNSDLIAAQKCGITYYDLTQLLTNLF